MKRGELGSLFCRERGLYFDGNRSYKYCEEGFRCIFRRIVGGGGGVYGKSLNRRDELKIL